MKKKGLIIISAIIVLLAITAMVYASFNLNKKNNEENSHLTELNYTELKEKINNKEDFILVITATECSHCATYKPVLKEVLTEHNIYAYEIDKEKLSDEEKSKFNEIANISGTPTTLFFTDGEEKTTANRLVGAVNKDKIVQRLTALGYIKD